MRRDEERGRGERERKKEGEKKGETEEILKSIQRYYPNGLQREEKLGRSSSLLTVSLYSPLPCLLAFSIFDYFLISCIRLPSKSNCQCFISPSM